MVTRLLIATLAATLSWAAQAASEAPRQATARAESGSATAAAPVSDAAAAVEERESTRIEREEVTARIEEARKRRKALEREVAAYGDDIGAIDRALISATERMQAIEGRIDVSEARLAELGSTRARLRASLAERRTELASVMASLQRMSRQPPPAILIAPGDALNAVRTSLLLGSAIPYMQARSGELRTEIAVLAETESAMATHRTTLRGDLARLAEDETRLTLLMEEKRGLLARSREEMDRRAREIERMAGQARSLDELLRKLDARIATAREEAERAARVDAQRVAAAEARLKAARERLARAGAADAVPGPRLGASVPFGGRKGHVARPVAGLELWSFGTRDPQTGKKVANVGIATRVGARVRAPADAVVQYAGPFRSFGHVLILDAGDGYQIVLTGLERTDVPTGRAVLAGEPVGRMGAARLAALAPVALGRSRPVLYVEFRHNGTPIDPGPWWADGAGRESRDAS